MIILSEVSTEVQHITALDFDIERAMQQLDMLHNKFNELTRQIGSQSWSIRAVIEGTGEYGRLQAELAETTQRIEELEEQIRSMSYTGSNSIIEFAGVIQEKLVSALKEAASAASEAVKSVENSMTDISRVLELTSSQTEDLRGSLFNLGKEYGRSFEDVSDIALRFAQAGNDMTDTVTLTRDALLALNTAELDSEEATQSLIGIMNQWGMGTEDLITIIDKLNYTADNNAVTTQDLIDGLLKASSMARTAGMSFDDTVGILTSMKVASGAAGKEVGNAFKSIMAYIQRPSSLNVFENMGIDVYADKVTGELLPMMEILENMSKKWNSSQQEMLNTLVASGDAAQMMSEEWAIATDSMDEYTQYQEAMTVATEKANTAEARAQAQAAAGVYRRNYYIALMESLADAQRISGELSEAEGHSMQENARYMETLTAKTEQLIVSLKDLAVTAADAGLLDLAKWAVDTAVKIAEFSNDLNLLLPLIATLGSSMLALKSMKISEYIIDNISALKSWGTQLKNTVNHVNDTGTALTGAAAKAATFKTAMFAAGTALTAISAAVTIATGIISNYNQKLDETIEKGEQAANSFDTLLELTERYNTLAELTDRTAEQESDYKSVQEEIIELLGERAEELNNLTKGTQAYNEMLKEQIKLELESQRTEVIAASDAAHDKLENTEYWKTTGSYGVEYNSEVYKALDSAGKIGYNSNGDSMVFYGGETAIETYANLAEIMDVLNGKLNELEKSNSDLADEFVNDSTYQKLKENYEQLSEAAEEYLAAEVKRQSITYILDNGIPETIQQQEDMNKAVIDAVDTTDKLTDKISGLITVYGTIDERQVKFYEAFNSNEFGNVSESLQYMAERGELTATVWDYMSRSNNNLSAKLKEFGITTEEAVIWLNELFEGTADVGEGIEEAGKEIEDFTKTIETAEDKISTLNGYIQTLGEGNGLTAEQVLELVDTYGLLLDQFTLTEQGYTIEVSALEKLREAQIKEAITAQESQIQQTLIIKENVLERLKAYGIEIEQITNLAEAQTALSLLQSDIAKESMSMSGSESDVKRMQSMAALADILEDVRDGFANTEDLAQGFYETLGMSFEETKKSGEETVDILKEITEGYEHLVSLGLYSTEEQIAYYENLRRTLSLTEEQYQSLESTLHKLYTTQLEESKEAIEAEYEAQKKAIEEQYELDKENREEYWDNEIDRIKDNLNSQIDSAKKAYEERKKLADKSYDNQKAALESLRDAEIEGIEASYNAQIDALEKIKAARQAERDEEDYQNERAELLEQISYYEQRTGTEAVEQLADLRKQLADLDHERQRELEDEEIDSQIDSLESQRDDAASAVKKQYAAQIAALEASQEIELEMYKATYEREIELLENRLEKETEALEKKRDEDLKRLEDEKEAAIKAADDKWAEIEAIFEDRNLAMIASAGMFAPELYDQFHELFTEKFKMDLDELSSLMGELEGKSSSFSLASGTKPTSTISKSVSSKVKNTEEMSSGGFSVGTQVKVSGTVYGDSYGGNPGTSLDSKKTTITRVNSNGTKPYHVGNLGWVDESQLVKARTGGKTTADGLAMLHKDELIINPPVTKMLEDLVKVLNPQVTKADIAAQQDAFYRYWGSQINASQRAMYQNVSNNNTYNNSNSTDNHSKQTINNININGPLQNIERVEDNADMTAAVNALERNWERQIASKL